MSNYLRLTKVLLKSGLGNFSEKKRKKNGKEGKNWTMIAVYIILVVCMIPVVKMLYDVGAQGYKIYRPLEQEGVVIELACYMGAMFTLVFSITMVLSVFYLAGDITTLLPLPLRPWEIVGAKFTVVLLYDYLTEILMLGPVFAGYGIASGSGILYWLFALLALFLIPVMPLVYASILSMLFMRIFKRANNKDFITMLSTGLMVVFAFIISSVSGSIGGSMGGGEDAALELLAKLNAGNNSLMGMSSKMFPNFVFLSKAIVFGDFTQMLLFLLTMIAAVAVFLFFAQKIYLGGVIGMTDSNSKRRRISKKEGEKINRHSPVLWSYTKKEWRTLMRTPVYFLNCALFAIIWPVMFLLPMGVSLAVNGADFSGFSPALIVEMLKGILSAPTAGPVLLLVFYGISVFAGVMNYTSGTAISREGKGIYFMKMIPVPYKTQVLAKMLVGILLGLIGSTLYTTIFSVVGVFMGLDFVVLPLGILLTAVTVVMQNIIQTTVDLAMPKLNWESEQMAVKQNMNPMIEMLVTGVIGGGLGVLAFFVYTKLDIPAYAVAVLGILVLVVMDVIGWLLVSSYAEKRLSGIDG